MKKISVIVPTYNCSAYILEAINSILAQSLAAEEIIIIDDGSTDTTELIVAQLKEPRIRYIKQSNGGVSKARNRGLDEAKGDYIAFLDADDRWRPEMLAEQSRLLDKHLDVALSFTNFIRFNEPSGELLAEQFLFYPELNSLQHLSCGYAGASILAGDGFSSLIDFGEIPGFTQAILFRRSAIAGMKFNEQLKVCEDAEFVLRATTKGKVAFNTHILLEVRRHQSNTTKDLSSLSIDKLNAFLTLQGFTGLSPQQRLALDNRLVKAYLDAAISAARKGQIVISLRYYSGALSIKGHALKKIKGLVRAILSLRPGNKI